MYRDRRDLPAFHERDIEKILQKFHLYEKLLKNELLCNICNIIITKENFGCIYLSKEGIIGISCANPKCLDKVSEEIEYED